MRPKQLRVITCPYCGYEYLPGEVFLPNDFLGQPKNIVRDVDGKIMGYEGIKMNDTETFKCDHCNKNFTVVSNTTFTSQISDADEEYVTKLSNDKLFLAEE